MRYRFIRSHRRVHNVTTMCRVLDVSTSGFYDWLNRRDSRRAQENRRLVQRIRNYHHASRQTYGSPRIFKDLRESGERCGVHRVARLMRQHRIQAKTARRFVITTDSRQTHQPAPDRLRRDFSASRLNQVWVSDSHANGMVVSGRDSRFIFKASHRLVYGYAEQHPTRERRIDDGALAPRKSAGRHRPFRPGQYLCVRTLS